jgi:putative ABC transport system permease protein
MEVTMGSPREVPDGQGQQSDRPDRMSPNLASGTPRDERADRPLRTDGGDTLDNEHNARGMSGGLWRFPAAALATRNLRRNKLRSLLAALGIGIGVFVIVVLGVFGTVLQLSASQELGSIGNQVIVSPSAETEAEALTPRQIQDIERAASGRGTAVPIFTDTALARAGGEQTPTQVYGVDNVAALFEGSDDPLPRQHRGGAYVGSGVAESLGVGVGEAVELDGKRYRVVGVLAPSEDITPIQADTAIVLPRREFSGGFDQAVVVADSPGDATAAAGEIRDTVNARTERVDIFELSELLDTINEFFSLLNRFLIALGSVSLVVAGVSILNLMLMSTAERRGEIGLMRAVGIHRESVLKVLLIEASLLGAIGGAVGALLSAVATFLLWAASPIGLDVIFVWQNALYLGGGLVFGSVVALVSGAYPAWKAASERPVEALRG